MAFDRVLLTGAAGRLGRLLRPALRTGIQQLRLNDVVVLAAEDEREVAVLGDLQDASVAAQAVAGVQAVVHLGGVADETSFDVLAGPNLAGTYNIFEGARRAGVQRVVFASSNRITGFYPASQLLSGDEPVRPDGLYGVTKAFGEALGRLYADKFGLEVICVRIGSYEQYPTEPRHLSTWLSPGDAIRLFQACLAVSPVSFATVYGVSANTRGWWDLEPARQLGYAPLDDAEAFASQIGESAPEGVQGDRFADPGYGGWTDLPFPRGGIAHLNLD